VEHFARLNQPGRVEACVVHLPIMSMDLNQVSEQPGHHVTTMYRVGRDCESIVACVTACW
jgi:hypothetical protein